MGCVQRIDYNIFMSLCDCSITPDEVAEAIAFAEACVQEERRTYSACIINDIVNHIN